MYRSRRNQQDLAALLEIHESSVSLILNGKRIPTLADAVRIERAMGIPVAAWLEPRPAVRGKGKR
jgi:plasmid maintenance system antidote protein VapI